MGVVSSWDALRGHCVPMLGKDVRLFGKSFRPKPRTYWGSCYNLPKPYSIYLRGTINTCSLEPLGLVTMKQSLSLWDPMSINSTYIGLVGGSGQATVTRAAMA